MVLVLFLANTHFPHYNESMITAKDIIVEIASPTEADIALINKAYDLAQDAHKDHTRYSGEPYINHLANVDELFSRGLL